uniref:Cytosol aminopeptidase domain-containing protein n=1 Tax=Haptolina brevifila TaxID=156173 RepID=A0A7S2GUU5_9EUKA
MSKVGIQASDGTASEWTGDLLVLPFWEVADSSDLVLSPDLKALDERLDGALSDLVSDQEFKGAAGSKAVISLPRSASSRRIAVVGLGNETKFTITSARTFGSTLASVAKEHKVKAMGALMSTGLSEASQQAILESAIVSLSPDTRYKSDADSGENKPPPLETIELIGSVSGAVIERARTLAAGVLVTRGLVGSPANYLTPTAMAQVAASLAADFSTLNLKVLEKAECEALGMGAYLGVAQGAIEPPKFIHLTYTPPGGAPSKKVALIGKGLTFDSGGYNIKAGAGSMIEKMKFDMGGAGAVLGAARSIAELAPEAVEVHFIIAACENMVSAEAMRPGDILTASNSKTIEVLNTDAEGRLTLADALVYADNLGNVDVIVDIATLTGACIVALGPDYGAMYTEDDDLLERLDSAAKQGGELLWRMPLAAEYKEQLKSPIADLANLGAPGGGGSITAALFLQEFVKKESPEAMWAHLDIAGPVWNDKKGGATGFGVRTLVGLVEGMSPA